METRDPSPGIQSEAAGAKPTSAIIPLAGARTPGGGRSGGLRLWTVGAGAAAALVSWLLVEVTRESFKPKGTSRRFVGTTLTVAPWPERAAAATKNAALALGLTGGAAGLALGLAGGLARSARAGLWAAAIGLVLGGSAGAGAALAAVPLSSHIRERDPGNPSAETLSSIIVHGLTWSTLGAAGGLAFALGLGGRARAVRGLAAGVLGGVTGAILYEVIGSLLLSGSKITESVGPTWDVRCLAQLLAVIPLAASVAALAGPPPDRSFERAR
jgi:hypothetical protein